MKNFINTIACNGVSSKYLIFIGFLLFLINVNAQVSPRKTLINGKEYFVYPYKCQKSYKGFDEDRFDDYNDFNLENEIVPYQGKLPDGEYVIYYAPIYYHRRIKPFHKKGYTDSTNVAAFFKLKNNLKEGEATFFSMRYRNVLEWGNYKNNQRQGFWNTTDYGYYIEPDYYKNPLVKKPRSVKRMIKSGEYPAFHKSTITLVKKYFENGIKSGPCKIVAMDDSSKVFAIGEYKNNKRSGHWESYYGKNILESSFTYADSLAYDPEENSKKRRNRFKNNYFMDFTDYDFYEGWYHEYYSNGQLKVRRFFKNGVSDGLDTVYFENGTIEKIHTIEKLNENDSIINYKSFTYDGEPIYEMQSINQEISFKKEYRYGKILEEQYDINYYRQLEQRDTVVPIKLKYKYQKRGRQLPTELDYIEYVHLKTGTMVEKNFNKNSNRIEWDDFKFSPDTASDILFLEKVDYRGAKSELEVRNYFRVIKSSDSSYYYTRSDSLKLMLKGKPFTGKFILRNGYYRDAKNERVKVKKNKIVYYSQKYGNGDEMGLPFRNHYTLPVSRRGDFHSGPILIRTSNTSYLNFKNGYLHGTATIVRGKHGVVWQKNNYSEGKMDGEQLEYSMIRTDRFDEREIVDKEISRKAKLTRKWRYFLSEKAIVYKNSLHGVRHTYHYNGQLESKSEYSYGMKNGNFESYNVMGNLNFKTSYINDNPHGEYKTWYSSGKPTYDLNYDNGILIGEYKYYFANGNFQRYGKIEDGFKVGDWTLFFSEGTPKYIETYEITDSVKANLYEDNQGSKRKDQSMVNTINSYKTCYSKQYYPTGIKAAEGKIQNGIRAGVWKFYDEGENLKKEINYESGYFLQTPESGIVDTVYHYGNYVSWHLNGTKESEAFILNEFNNYDCYQQTELAIQDLYFVNFWTKDKIQILKDRNGRIATVHSTTAKPESEGELVNGLREGYWRFWDPDGKLSRVGNYVNGKENGVWLEGDLEGFNYLDDACFDLSNPNVIKQMEYNKKVLKLYVMHYTNGEIIKQNSFDVNLNKDSFSKYGYKGREVN